MGVNILKGMMRKIPSLASLEVNYTNHSLRATAASRMFGSGVPEKIVAKFTGHKSIKSLRQYERTTCGQLQSAGLAIAKMKPFSCNETDVKAEKDNTAEVDDKAALVNSFPPKDVYTRPEL